MPTTTTNLKTALYLRVIALAAFPLGALAMAIAERGWAAIGLLAAAMLAVSFVERRRLARLADAPLPFRFGGLASGLIVRFILLTGLFVIALGILTLFRDTSLARALSFTDLGIVLGAAVIALGANEISARLATHEMSGAMASVQARVDTLRAAAKGDIIEGEIIDSDPPR
jgi:hypothetical protein